MLKGDCELRLAAALDLAKAEVVSSTEKGIAGQSTWTEVGHVCVAKDVAKVYGLCEDKHIQEFRKTQVTHVLRVLLRALHKSKEALAAAWNEIMSSASDLQNDELLQDIEAFQTIFNADPVASLQEDSLEVAVARVASRHADPFVKHVSAMASFILRPLTKASRTHKATGADAATVSSVAAKCSKAKASSLHMAQASWEEIAAEMAHWRTLATALSEMDERKQPPARSNLQDAWGNVWSLVIQPHLETLSSRCRDGRGACEHIQELSALARQACAWLDGYKLSGLALEGADHPKIHTYVATAMAFAKVGAPYRLRVRHRWRRLQRRPRACGGADVQSAW